jgi:5-methylcytosine-specific restriction endonuclease McrA
MSLNRATLVLNASYEAINVCAARRAIRLVLLGAAEVLENSGTFVRTPQISLPVPSVIRLRKYARVPRQNRSVSRKGILLRDNNSCQYCQAKMLPRQLTMDHVIPRSRGGASTWENLVASCFACNNKKGDRTPGEAGMTLAKQPRQLHIHAKHRLLAADEQVWQRYLF